MNTVIEQHADSAVSVPFESEKLPVETAANPLDLPSNVFCEGLNRRKANRSALMEWVRSSLIEGVDFGSIQTRRGPSKPSLWKPGAEKICGMLGVIVRFPNLQDYEQAALHAVELQNIIIRCEIIDASGRIVAQGIGARSLKQDYGDINKSLKMAEKSAHIDAALRMAGLSEVFTQDLEDMSFKEQDAALAGSRAEQNHPTSSSPAREPSGSGPVPPGKNGTSQFITTLQHKRLEARINELGLARDRVKSWISRSWGVEHLNRLPRARYEALNKRLAYWAAKTEHKGSVIERGAVRSEPGNEKPIL